MLKRLILMAMAGALAACATAPESPDRSAPMIVLKLDDFRADDGVHPGWAQVFDFLNAQDVTATIGVIGEGLEQPDPDGVAWLLAQDARGHELWNHGYCHCRSGEGAAQIREFRGTPFEEQLAAIIRTQQLGKEVLGLTFTSFGAPYNSTDAATARALGEVDALDVWMFKETSEDAAPTGKTVLERIAAVNIEYPVHIPDLDQFLAGYEAHRDARVLVIQGHPQSWVEEPERYAEFKRIVLYLKSDGARFVTPIEATAKEAAS